MQLKVVTSEKKIPPSFYQEAILDSEPWKTLFSGKRKSVYRLKPGEKLFLAKVKQKTAGLLVWHPNFLGGSYLKLLSVHPKYRNKKIGQKLMTQFEKAAYQECQSIFLCVSSFNKSAQKFYAKMGYQKIGVLKQLIHPKYDEILMRKIKS